MWFHCFLLLFQMAHMGLYGNGFQIPQPFPQYQMPMWPQPQPNAWQNPPEPQHQTKTDQTQETQKPNQTQPKNPPQKQPLKQPPQATTQGKEETQPPQVRLTHKKKSQIKVSKSHKMYLEVHIIPEHTLPLKLNTGSVICNMILSSDIYPKLSEESTPTLFGSKLFKYIDLKKILLKYRVNMV